VQKLTPALFFVPCDLHLWPSDTKINGLTRLTVEHFYVKFGDPSGRGFWDIVRINRQTDKQTIAGKNPSPRLPPAWVNTQTRLSQYLATLPGTKKPLSAVEKDLWNKYVRLQGTAVYPHMPILRPHATRFHHEQRISSATFGLRADWTINRTYLIFHQYRENPLFARWPIRPILGF